jgi:DNA-binding HxlR family transcriptional regulator
MARAVAPVNAALELLGRRWALRLVWELRRDALPFGALRDRTGISSSVLAARLRELTKAGVIERGPQRRYRLTPLGRELARVLYDLNRWAEAAARGEREVARPSQEAILDSVSAASESPPEPSR